MSFIDYLNKNYSHLNEAKTDKKYQPKDIDELEKLIKDETIHLGDIDTSKIKETRRLFRDVNRTDFSGIETWDVSNVEDMSHMFEKSKFNGDISKWDVSNVKDMSCMFKKSIFNKDISKWDVSNVERMDEMFYQSEFNKSISKWNVSNVKDMNKMFASSEFNKDISKWNISNVKYMNEMFSHSEFNRDISKWDVSKKYMYKMFAYCHIKDEYKPKGLKE